MTNINGPWAEAPEYFFTQEELEQWAEEQFPKKFSENPKCECGAEKTYGKNTTHTDWCPKWEES